MVKKLTKTNIKYFI